MSASHLPADLAAHVTQWLAWDENPITRAEVEALVAANDVATLQQRFASRIAFGTAGLRGTMAAGIACMNDVTVRQASQGLVIYMEKVFDDLKTRGVCIGYDGRHNSKTFAGIAAATFLHRGVPVYLFSVLVPTPFVAFGVKHLNCCGGVMVTASHNPKDDNGYKVYWDAGSQIVAPHDTLITEEIGRNLERWQGVVTDELLRADNPLLHDPTEQLANAYYEASVRQCSFTRELNANYDLTITFTPMHGVGQPWAERVFREFQLKPFVSVPLQREPDPDFPTVPFPNPEEGKGALKLAMEAADAANSPVIIANDPDADRLAAAEKQPSGEWKVFTGNEIGILFADWVWSNFHRLHPEVEPAKCAVLNSTVSSKFLKALADKEGLHYDETLTGFKWLGNMAQELGRQGYHFLFAYEEAIGYMISDVCLDKDGIRAAAAFGELASSLYAKGQTLQQHLESLYAKYGYFATKNRYFFCYQLSTMKSIFQSISQGHYPSACGEYAISRVRDLQVGYDSGEPDQKARLPRSSYMVTFYFENGAVITVRGSGTEPKLKYYAELSGNFADKDQVDATLAATLAALIHDLLNPEANDLKLPRD